MNTRKNGFKFLFCALTIGITLGYIASKLMEKLDWHIVCMEKNCGKPRFIKHGHECCDDDMTEDCDCSEDSNEAEPYTEPLDDNATTYHDEQTDAGNNV